MNFFDFQLRAWLATDKEVQVLVHSSPVGGMRQPVKVPFESADFESACKLIRDNLLSDPNTQPGIVEAGKYLSSILLPSEVNSYLIRSLATVGEDGLRVRLCLDAALVDAPWEFMLRPDALTDEIMQSFLVLNPRVSLVREAPVESSKLEPSREQQRMVILGAFYEGGEDYFQVGDERQKLIQLIEPVKRFLKIDEKFTTAAGTSIEDALNTPLSVFHYAGHVHLEDGCGFLVREVTTKFQNDGSDHQTALYSNRKLDVLLRRAGVRIAVFNACDSGRWAFVEPLLKAGLPALIGLQGGIGTDGAIAFCQRLYSSLAVGLSLDDAVIYARLYLQEYRVMQGAASCEWGSYMVYMPTTEAVLLPKPDEQPEVQEQQEEVRRSVSLMQSKRSLRLALMKEFNEEDLNVLCADLEEDLKLIGTDLEVDLEIAGGGNKEAKILNLIDYLDRRGHLPLLLTAAQRARPNISI